MEMEHLIREQVQESLDVKMALVRENTRTIAQIAALILKRLKSGNKLLLFGNGGSAADAQHIAAELIGRYHTDRKALPAVALTTDTSVLTAVGNDYGFQEVFARQISALGCPGDVALAISTSGNSPNVLKGVVAARRAGMHTVGLTGRTGGKIKALVDYCLCVPSSTTARIQEAHIMMGHIVSYLVERAHLTERIRRKGKHIGTRGRKQ